MTNFIGVALFCLLGLALSANLMASQDQTKLLTKSLPSRLVSQLPPSGLLNLFCCLGDIGPSQKKCGEA